MILKNKTKLIVTSVFASMFLLACGSSSDNTNTTSANTGYFIDAAVSNVHYQTTSGLSGDTDSFGRFKYNTGDKVKLSLGKLILGEVEPQTDGLITPKHLIAGDEAPSLEQSSQIALLLRTLQSLDSDNNASNGITIDSNVITDLDSLTSEVDFHTIDEQYLIDLDNDLTLGLDEDYDGHLDVNETKAKDHFDESETKWENGHKPDDNENGNESHGNGNGQGQGNGQGNGNGNGQGNGQGNGNGNGQGNGNGNGEDGGTPFNVEDTNATANLSIDIKKSLAYMGNEERLAYDVYNALGTTFSDVKQFTNIASKSEIKHIQSVQKLIQRYDINDTELSDGNFTSLNYQDTNISNMTPGVYGVVAVQDLYNALIAEGNVSKVAALKVGCKVEVVDVTDLDEYITQANDANASDVSATFDFLRKGSYKHYWAFDKALKKIGVSNGCDLNTSTDTYDFGNKSEIYPKD